MSNSVAHDILRDQIILAVSENGLGRVFPFEVGLFRLYDRPNQVIRIGVNGISDLVGLTNTGKFLAIEVKSGRGVLRKSQINFMNMVLQMNGIFIVGRNPEQVIAEIRTGL